MRYETMFRFLLVAPADDLEETASSHLSGIVAAIEARGTAVIHASSLTDARLAVENDAAIGCILAGWSEAEGIATIREFVRFVRERGHEMPLFILVNRHQLREINAETLKLITGYVFAGEDTPEFLAKNLLSHLIRYADDLKTPFFGAMVDYAEQGNQMWTCPGHNGGVFYRKSPIGRIFVEHLGEAVFRNDLDNSVVELGDLLSHEGPALQAEIEAAKIFGSERTYFVLNGTSTSNKMGLSALVAPGDLVLFDRNNHKAAVHGALLLSGGIPVYLETTRNAYGLIGPVRVDALDEAAIREQIRVHPLITDSEAWRRPRPFRVGVIEQCTYDGTIYSAEQIFEKLGPLCDYLFFDEAWAGFMKFHPLFHGRFAMGLTDLGADAPGIIATQSTHKQLAGFSQASQIHVKDSHLPDVRRVEPRRFNEFFMLHSSTSPFYPLFASLDVGAQMMKGRSGTVLWDDTIRLGIELRKKIRSLKAEYESASKSAADAWFFDPFVPDIVPNIGESGEGTRWEDIPTDRLASEPNLWGLAPGAAWHGFAGLASGYAMTDPNKLTLLTPGFDRETGKYAATGVPAPVVAEFLREQRIVPEKNDFHSILFLLTPGLESSKAGTLLSGLVAFKRLHDENAPLASAMPDLVSHFPERYGDLGLRDLCRQLHDFYREHDASRLQAEQFAGHLLPEIVLPPREAWEHLLRNQIDYVPISEVEGRVAATLALVYPPGIGVVVPGERYGGRARATIDYLLMFERASNLFPGFENEIQGVYRERTPEGTVRLFTYVLHEKPANRA